LALLDGLAEIRIADGLWLNQIHGAPEELLQVLLQAEITFRVLGGAQLWKLDKKVEVARDRIEGAAGRRAEQQQSLHLPSTADSSKLQRLFLEDGVHNPSSGCSSSNRIVRRALLIFTFDFMIARILYGRKA
jgi:hypothetical protein